jgi:hypothetical protein
MEGWRHGTEVEPDTSQGVGLCTFYDASTSCIKERSTTLRQGCARQESALSHNTDYIRNIGNVE